jgi:catechol 2,3-dioxygenase-like lactoylglutathione lyase family enzyme
VPPHLGLRWEVLRAPEDDTPLALNERVRLSRYLESSDFTPLTLPLHPDLRALVVVANPSDLGDYGLAEIGDEMARAHTTLGNIPTDRMAHTGSFRSRKRENAMALMRMDNVGIVVESLDTAIAFFAELGMTLEGRTTIEGAWAGRVTGLGDQHVEIAMMVTPDGHSRLELSRFVTPPVVADHRNAPVNALGYLRVMFAVDDLDDVLARLRTHGAQLVGDVVQYEDMYRLCYIRGPEGLLIGLAEQLG